MTRAVLFDLGDTLFRLSPMADVTDEFADTLTTEGVADAEDEAVRIIESLREAVYAGYARGDLVEPSIAEIAAPFIGTDARARRLAGSLDDLLGEADIARWAQAAGRDAVFDALRSQGIRVAFVSNTLTSPDRMRRRLDEFGLLRHAEHAVFSVEQRVRKPNPNIYRAALDALGIEAAEAIFVGDRVREDVRGPQALGMRGVLTHEFRQEDPADASPLGVITRLGDLLDLLD